MTYTVSSCWPDLQVGFCSQYVLAVCFPLLDLMHSSNVSRATNSSEIRGIIFDIGGVVLTSPLIAIAAYEREKGFPRDWINVLMLVALIFIH
jgi:hypothetical protein